MRKFICIGPLHRFLKRLINNQFVIPSRKRDIQNSCYVMYVIFLFKFIDGPMSLRVSLFLSMLVTLLTRRNATDVRNMRNETT